MSLFNIDLPGIINDAMGGLVLDATISVSTRSSDGQGGQTLSYENPVAAKGFTDTYSDFQRLSGVPATDRKIVILAASTSVVPKEGDRVTIEGRTYDVISVNKDPASATYELQCR